MEKRNKNIILYSIAILFLTILTSSLTVGFVVDQNYVKVFWMCYILMIIVSIGIFFKKPNLILSQIIILLIPNFFWSLDIIITAITRVSIFGFASYVFTDDIIPLARILTFHHLITVPLSILAVFLMRKKANKKYIFISLAEVLVLFILGVSVPNLAGINCLPKADACTHLFALNSFQYSTIWLFVILSLMGISYMITNYILRKKRLLEE